MTVCTYCGSSRKIQDDHIRAQVNGGRTTVPACSWCNQSKGAKQLMTWFRWLKRKNGYRWRRIAGHNARKRSDIARKIRRVRDE